MPNRFTFSTTEERLNRISHYVDVTKKYSDMSSVINASIDKFLDVKKIEFVADFMYFIGIPLFIFIASFGLTFVFPYLVFFVVTVLTGSYLMIFIFLFYHRYRGIKWQ